MSHDAPVPGYEPMLAAYHRAFEAELRAMVNSLPLAEGRAVLDMACGDGAYSPWLADRVGPTGRVVAVDVSPDYLELAREAAARSPHASIVEFACAPIEALPFDDGTFDLCWCAQSLYSLPDPVAALRHMLRVARPGGFVAVLEGDTLHDVILPWPVEVELSARAAELKALAEGSDRPRKFYVGRQLRRLFREAGLVQVRSTTFAADRSAPLGPDERTFFAEYLKRLARSIAKTLDGPIRREFDALVDPGSPAFLLDDPDLTATCIGHVVLGRKPT